MLMPLLLLTLLPAAALDGLEGIACGPAAPPDKPLPCEPGAAAEAIRREEAPKLRELHRDSLQHAKEQSRALEAEQAAGRRALAEYRKALAEYEKEKAAADAERRDYEARRKLHRSCLRGDQTACQRYAASD